MRAQARSGHHHVLQPFHPQAHPVDGEDAIAHAHAVLRGGLGDGGDGGDDNIRVRVRVR